MELERGQIQRRDFATARRGYDQAEVDRHLSLIASAVEELRASAQTREPPTVAGVAAERVEAIVAAAEASAREIHKRAEDDAARIRAEATDDLRSAREAAAEIVTRAGALVEHIDELIVGLGSAEPEPEPGPPDAEPEVVEAVIEEVAAELAPEPAEGARLVALNMALSGTPREETARYLRENFDLQSPDDLLDDVYAKAGS